MLQLSAIVPNLCPQPKSSLINRLSNDQSAVCLTNRVSDITSTHQYLASEYTRSYSTAMIL